MFDFEGSRSELMKLLVELGEEPAFLARGRAPQIALDALLNACAAKHAELLQWPKYHLATLAHHVASDWARLGRFLSNPDDVAMLQTLHASLPGSLPVQGTWFTSDRAALQRFLESAERFNRHWLAYLNGLDLEPVNKPRRDFNQFYALEKACAVGNESAGAGNEPLEMIDANYLRERYPLLVVPTLA